MIQWVRFTPSALSTLSGAIHNDHRQAVLGGEVRHHLGGTVCPLIHENDYPIVKWL